MKERENPKLNALETRVTTRNKLRTVRTNRNEAQIVESDLIQATPLDREGGN